MFHCKYEPWTEYSNQELHWFSTDSKTLYEHNLSYRYDQLLQHSWVNSSITYNFNSEGFRSKEFTDTDSIMFLGCSITQGIGLPYNALFSTIVSENLQLNSCNMGLYGSSSNTAFRLAHKYLTKIKPKILVCHLVFPDRLEIFTPEKVDFLVPNFDHLIPKFGNQKIDFNNFMDCSDDSIALYKQWISVPENSFYNHLSNLLAIEKLCDSLSIKFVNISDRSEYKKFNFGLARDLLHPGKGFHSMLANLILEKINY